MPLRYIRIVDNDPAAALVTQLGLQSRLKNGFEVAIATSHEPDQRYTIHSEFFIDLVIVDPGAQSQAATRLVKSLQTSCPQTPVLVLTAYDSPRLRAQMRLLGIEYYLAKPIDLDDLERVVRVVLDTAQSTADVAGNGSFSNIPI